MLIISKSTVAKALPTISHGLCLQRKKAKKGKLSGDASNRPVLVAAAAAAAIVGLFIIRRCALQQARKQNKKAQYSRANKSPADLLNSMHDTMGVISTQIACGLQVLVTWDCK